MTIIRKDNGFTLLEVLIVMGILGVIMLMTSFMIVDMMNGVKEQGKVVASQLESALGLEMMKNDIENAGFGLADSFPSGAAMTYGEATGSVPSTFNDTGGKIPRALVLYHNVGDLGGASPDYMTNSDYLVIKSPAVGINSAAGKWTYISGTAVKVWGSANLDMVDGNGMIIIKPAVEKGGKSTLLLNAGAFAVSYTLDPLAAAFQTKDATTSYVAYGVDEASALRMPYNRADYYVGDLNVEANSARNQACAPGTGALIKSTVDQDGAGTMTKWRLVDCVAGMKILFRVDTNSDGIPDTTTNSISTYSAYQIKESVKEVQVSVLAHEGTMDKKYNYSGDNPVSLGNDTVDLSTFGTDWTHYRWKIYRLSIKPKSFY